MQDIKTGIAGGSSTLLWYPLYQSAKIREAFLGTKLNSIPKMYHGVSTIGMTSVIGYTLFSTAIRNNPEQNKLLMIGGCGIVAGSLVTPLVCINANQIKCRTNIRDTCKNMILEGGYRSFVRGIVPLTARATIFGTSMFFVRENVNESLLQKKYSKNVSMELSILAGTTTSILLTQWVDILSTNMEMDPARKQYPNAMVTGYKIKTQCGIHGLLTRAFSLRWLQTFIEFHAFPLFLRLL